MESIQQAGALNMMRGALRVIVMGALLAGGRAALGQSATAPASGITLVAARPLNAMTVKATGRVYAVTTALISPRVDGHLRALGQDAQGRPLDVGMRVKKGDVLFVLDETTFRNEVAATEAALASAQASLENLKAPTRPERIEQLNAAIREIETRLEEKKRDEERYTRLVEERTSPAKRLEEARTELVATQSQLAAAKSRLEEARNGATRTEILVAEARVKEVEALLKMKQDDLRDVKVTAPFDALITKRLKSVGDYIAAKPAVEVFELVSTEVLEAEVRVPEAYYTRVKAGETSARLESSLLASPVEAKVTRVVGEIDPARGTFACRITVPGSSGLLPGAFVTAQLMMAENTGQVMVPARAVRVEEGKEVVYIAQDGQMKRREVSVGERLTETVIVNSGVRVGEQVVIGPAGSLKEGAAVVQGNTP